MCFRAFEESTTNPHSPRHNRPLCKAYLRIVYGDPSHPLRGHVLPFQFCVAPDELSGCELADSCHMRLKEVDLQGGDVWVRLSITTK
jgi:hypothetical protein